MLGFSLLTCVPCPSFHRLGVVVQFDRPANLRTHVQGALLQCQHAESLSRLAQVVSLVDWPKPAIVSASPCQCMLHPHLVP